MSRSDGGVGEQFAFNKFSHNLKANCELGYFIKNPGITKLKILFYLKS